MKALNGMMKVIGFLISAFSVLLAAILIVYSGYVIYDNFYKGQTAFTSAELAQYKPEVSGDSKLDFQKLLELNADAVGWLTVYDTNIDYPVMQGEDDLEYANKDVYGNDTLTGSIYLDSENNKDFLGNYNVIYGHHMDNGAMFGDLEKYADRNYFMAHRDGFLQTPEGNYELKIFAAVRLDAYDAMIYSIYDRNKQSYKQLMDYIREHSIVYEKEPDAQVTKIIALSTCYDADTLGRMIVFAEATATDAIPASAQVERGERKAYGHKNSADHWALLNLVCVILAFVTILPITQTGKKYRQIKYSKKIVKTINAQEDVLAQGEREELEKIVADLKSFLQKMRIGVVLEIVVWIVSVIVFMLTENIFRPMVLQDAWTWLMVLLFALALLLDFSLFRYRGMLPPAELLEDARD